MIKRFFPHDTFLGLTFSSGVRKQRVGASGDFGLSFNLCTALKISFCALA
jgi:hypothetical protein